MKHLCFYFTIGLLITFANAAVDVEKTVRNVQLLLEENTLLPRLTKEEIMTLLNDIRSEDAKSTTTIKHLQKEAITTTPYSAQENEINPITHLLLQGNVLVKDKIKVTTSAPASTSETTTKKNAPSLTVVLPYTPRDGSSLQELYTRPPRVEVVPVPNTTPKPVKTSSNSVNIEEILNQNAKIANNQNIDFPADLQAFLDAHGLTGKPGSDHFLLPLEGFKPLPPAPVIDGKVQLPENIILSYDLVPPNIDEKPANRNEAKVKALSPNNFLFEPLRPELPFELDTSSSNTKKHMYPFDLPKSRKAKSAGRIPTPNYEAVDYDSYKVIPLNKGINPVKAVKFSSINGQNKRQTNNMTNEENITEAPETTTLSDLPLNISTFDAPIIGDPLQVPEDADPDNPIGMADTETPITDADSESSIEDTDSEPSLGDAESEALLGDAILGPPSGNNADPGPSIADLVDSFGGAAPLEPGDSQLPPPRKNGFYWMLDWNSFLEVGDGDTKVNIRFEPKLGDHQMFLPVNVP